MRKFFLSMLCLSFIVVANSSCCKSETEGAAAQSEKSTSDVVTENIMARRSIRAYQPQQVGKDTLDQILAAAINTPSAMNKQPWDVRVVRNADLLAKLKDAGGNFFDAPTLIIVAYDTTNPYGIFDTGLFSQTVMLSAESFGLGTVALGSVPNALNKPESEELLKELAFEPYYQVVIGIALGYKNQNPPAKPRDNKKIKFIE
jgi:nitroreductase